MSESKIKNENVFHVSGWMVNELKLSGNSLMVFAIIFGFSQDGESYFTGSRKYLCDFTGASKPTIDKALNELIEKKYIYKYSEKRNDVIYNKYQVNLEILNFTTSKETLPPCKETLPNNIEDNIDKEISIINNTKEMEIFEHWNKKNIIIHRDFDKLEKKIKEALKEHDLETIKSAIDHYSEVINNQEYFYKYKWTLEQFLSRGKGLVEFTDKGSKWLNYLDFKNKNNKNKEISRETAYPEFDDVGYIR